MTNKFKPINFSPLQSEDGFNEDEFDPLDDDEEFDEFEDEFEDEDEEEEDFYPAPRSAPRQQPRRASWDRPASRERSFSPRNLPPFDNSRPSHRDRPNRSRPAGLPSMPTLPGLGSYNRPAKRIGLFGKRHSPSFGYPYSGRRENDLQAGVFKAIAFVLCGSMLVAGAWGIISGSTGPIGLDAIAGIAFLALLVAFTVWASGQKRTYR